jgi:hypothetical protein
MGSTYCLFVSLLAAWALPFVLLESQFPADLIEFILMVALNVSRLIG